MKRYLPFALMLATGAFAYACSSSDDNTTPETPVPEAGTEDDTGSNPQPDGSTPDGSTTDSGTDSGEDFTGNPIEGLAAAKQIKDLAQFSDGPQVIGTSLYVALPFATNGVGGGPGILVKMNLDGTSEAPVRAGDGAELGVVGNSTDKAGNLISAERRVVTRTAADGGAPVTIATNYAVDGGTEPFNAPNDLVARVTKDNTIYVTDPGYGNDPADFVNKLVRIPATGAPTLVDTFANLARPNGIALSPDENTLYVSFTKPPGNAKPFIQKYTLKADGTVASKAVFTELPVDSDPDGLAVDKGGNVYVAWKNGVNVYKADGTRYGADPSIPMAGPTAMQIPTGLTFGGADKKTLFMTTQSGKIFTYTVKIPGLTQ